MADNNSTTLGDRPNQPSKSKLGIEREFTTDDIGGSGISGWTPADNPLQADRGWDVSDYFTVLLTVHPITPTFGTATLEGAQVRIRPWRWRERAAKGSGNSSGQWFHDPDIILGLDGQDITGPMEAMFQTKNSEIMWFQIIQFDHDAAVTTRGCLTVYGVGEKRSTGLDLTPYHGLIPIPPEPPAEVAAALGLVCQDSMLVGSTNDNGATYIYPDFFCEIQAGLDQIDCTGYTEFDVADWFEAHRVIAVARKKTGADQGWDWRIRGVNLECRSATAGAMFRIDFDGDAWLNLTDFLIVYVEGPQHRFAVEGIDGISRQRTRDEAFTIATQSERTEEIAPLDQRYVPDILELEDITVAVHDYYFDMAAFRFFTMQLDWAQATHPIVTIWATAQDDGTAPAACFYTDMTNTWFGAATFAADTLLEKDTHTPVKYIRLRIDNSGGAATNDINAYIKRMW